MKLEPPFVFSLDQTEWRLGKRLMNVLMLGIVSSEALVIPLVWLVYKKKGGLDAEERKLTLNRFLAIFPVTLIRFVSADREIACAEWLQYLQW